MNLNKVLKAITNRNVVIEHYFPIGNKLLYSGDVKKVPLKITNEKWLVREIVLSDKENYNSDYIITVY